MCLVCFFSQVSYFYFIRIRVRDQSPVSRADRTHQRSTGGEGGAVQTEYVSKIPFNLLCWVLAVTGHCIFTVTLGFMMHTLVYPTLLQGWHTSKDLHNRCLFGTPHKFQATLSICFPSLRDHWIGGLMSSVFKTFISFLIPVSICLSKAAQVGPVTPSSFPARRECQPTVDNNSSFVCVHCKKKMEAIEK